MYALIVSKATEYFKMTFFFVWQLMGIEIEPEYGGSGMSFLSSIVAIEEISKVDPAVAVYVDIHNTLVTSLIRKVGNPEQKKKYLPDLAQCKVSTSTILTALKTRSFAANSFFFQGGSIAISEPTSGSDAFSMKTTAKKDGSDYILNGSKMWISNADVADTFLIMANANPSAVSIFNDK